jgi:long-chain acyl-CoA synthetase
MTAVLPLRAAPPVTLDGLLDRAAATVPAAAAVACGPRRLSWSELHARTGALAAGLVTRGIEPGDAVALLAADGPQFVLGLLAIARAGAVAVPLNPAFKRPELEFCVREAGARAVLTEDSGRGVDAARELQAPATIALADVLAAGGDAPSSPAPPDAPAAFTYSAGATGRPKRVPRTHRQLAAEAGAFAAATALGPADRLFCTLPLHHAYGFGCCLLAALRSGATLVFAEEQGPLALDRDRVLALIERSEATVFPAVPFALRVLAEASGAADLSRLRLVFSAGTRLPRATFAAFTDAFGVPPRQLYGCTEAGVVTVNLDPDARATAGSVGVPVAGVEVSVLGPSGEPVEPGRHGEIAIRSDAMTRGYAGVPDQVNHEAFPDGAFRTGDRGRLDEAGRLWITGRRKRLIDVSGEKVDPVEVEDVLAVHPRVREVVVVGAASGVQGEEVVKAVVVADGACGERELVRFCRERLADYKAPRSVEFRDAIPRGSAGEVLRKYLV